MRCCLLGCGIFWVFEDLYTPYLFLLRSCGTATTTALATLCRVFEDFYTCGAARTTVIEALACGVVVTPRPNFQVPLHFRCTTRQSHGLYFLLPSKRALVKLHKNELCILWPSSTDVGYARQCNSPSLAYCTLEIEVSNCPFPRLPAFNQLLRLDTGRWAVNSSTIITPLIVTFRPRLNFENSSGLRES